MPAERAETPLARADTHRAAFVKQSTWLMVATIAGGAMMWGVHFLNKAIPESEYGLFVAFLSVAMCIPTMPLQMVLAQQTAQALATNRKRELAGMIRLVCLLTFGVWLVSAVAVLLFQGKILEIWHVSNSVGLWVTLAAVLLSLWVPLFSGVLQGQQNFMWLGWTMILNGISRVGVASFAVLVLGGCAAGMMTGVLLGLVIAVAIAIWQTRAIWLAPSLPFDRRSLLGHVVPLMLGFGAFQFLFTADTMFVKSYFTGDETAFYGSAGTLSRALMWLVGPLATVMFPRIVHSTAKAEKNDLMGLVLLGTAILAIAGAVGLALAGPLIVRVVAKASYVPVASSILPWYAGAMVPLAMANVLVNNLLAKSDFRLVPWLVALALAYVLALTQFHASLVQVLQTLGVACSVLFLICAWFTWGAKGKARAEAGG